MNESYENFSNNEDQIQQLRTQSKNLRQQINNEEEQKLSNDLKILRADLLSFQEENQRLKFEVTELKNENEKLNNMISEKADDFQVKMVEDSEIKDKKLRALENELDHERKLIEELRLELVSKQLDRDNLKAQLVNKSFSPLLFLNDYSRNEFWKMITKYESETINFSEEKLLMQQQTMQQKSIITKQESEILVLKQQLEDYFKVRKDFSQLKLDYDKLYDKYCEVEHNYKEINLRFQGLEKTYFYLEKEREGSTQKIQELTNLLHERSIESNNEKKALREFLNRLEHEKGLTEDSNRREKDFSSYRINKVTRSFNLQDYFVRLKTTSISSEKFAETVEVLYELLQTEKTSKQEGKPLSSESVTIQLKNREHYRLFLKALASKNTKVLHSIFKMLKDLGDIDDRVEEYIESQASSALIKTYKTNEDYSVKQESLYFLKVLCDNSEKVAIEVAKFGATQTIIDDLRKYTRGVNVLSPYLVELLEFMSKVCKNSQGIAEFLSPNCMSNLVLCLNTEKIDNKVHAMNSIMYMAKTQENRQILKNYDIFNIIMSNLIQGFQAKEKRLINSAISALAYFSFERAYRILLANANQMFTFYQLLLQSIAASNNHNDQTPATTRYGASVIISKMLSDKDLVGVHDIIMKEGVLTYIARGLKDSQPTVKRECANIVIQLSKYIDTRIESFKPLIGPLISSLGDEDESLVTKSLECLRTLAQYEVLRDHIIDNGCVSILCSYIIQDLEEVHVEVLKQTVALVVILISNQEARQIIFEASIILPILGFLSSNDVEIRGLWYEGLKELCAYQLFRQQIEGAENAITIVKRAIRQTETTFILQLIAVVRVLCQSPILLERLIDNVTMPKLFEIFNDALKWADSNIEIYILQILKLFFANINGKQHILKNETMIRYATNCLLKENVDIANEAANLFIEILQEPQFLQQEYKLKAQQQNL